MRQILLLSLLFCSMASIARGVEAEKLFFGLEKIVGDLPNSSESGGFKVYLWRKQGSLIDTRVPSYDIFKMLLQRFGLKTYHGKPMEVVVRGLKERAVKTFLEEAVADSEDEADRATVKQFKALLSLPAIKTCDLFANGKTDNEDGYRIAGWHLLCCVGEDLVVVTHEQVWT